MTRLPQPGADQGTWGDILNQYLQVAHTSSGTLKTGSIAESQLAVAVQTKIDSSGVKSVNTRTGAITLVKSDVGLGSVNNTSDTAKPVSTAVQTAINLKADASALTAHTANMSNPHNVNKSQVGLYSVDNTSDVNKPVSIATQTALSLKASLASPTFTGTVTVPTPINNTDAATKNYVDTMASVGTPDADATTKGKLQLSGDLGGTASAPTVPGLALKADASALTAHTANLNNPHGVTKAQVGLGNVTNVALLVLGPSDPVPTGTPTGTVIVRTT